jgi:hypothetical protein
MYINDKPLPPANIAIPRFVSDVAEIQYRARLRAAMPQILVEALKMSTRPQAQHPLPVGSIKRKS